MPNFSPLNLNLGFQSFNMDERPKLRRATRSTTTGSNVYYVPSLRHKNKDIKVGDKFWHALLETVVSVVGGYQYSNEPEFYCQLPLPEKAGNCTLRDIFDEIARIAYYYSNAVVMEPVVALVEPPSAGVRNMIYKRVAPRVLVDLDPEYQDLSVEQILIRMKIKDLWTRQPYYLFVKERNSAMPSV